jgi:hypothetical protein
VVFLGVLWVSFTAKLLAWIASTVLRAKVQFRLAGFQRLKDVTINFQKVCGVFSLLQIRYHWELFFVNGMDHSRSYLKLLSLIDDDT